MARKPLKPPTPPDPTEDDQAFGAPPAAAADDTSAAEPDDTALGDDATPDTDDAAEEAAETPEDEAAEESVPAKIADMENHLEWPGHLTAVRDRFQLDRDYVNHDCMLSDDEATVVTNYILRNQFVLQSNIYAKDPTVEVIPKAWMGDMPPNLEDFARTVELVAKRLATEADFKRVLLGALQDVQTCGIAWLKVGIQQDFEKDPIGLRRQNDQLDNIARLGSLVKAFEAGLIQEGTPKYRDLVDLSDTVRQYLKDQVNADLAANPPQMVPAPTPGGADPAAGLSPDAPAAPPAPGTPPAPSPDDQAFGAPGPGDAMGGAQPGLPGGMVAPAQTMQPDPSDPRVLNLLALDQHGAPIPSAALPEVPSFIGVNVDAVQPEDVIFDWNITRPEDFYQAQWVSHSVYMSKEDIQAKWDDVLDEDDWTFMDSSMISSTNRGGIIKAPTTNEDPADRSRKSDQINDRHRVIEWWDRMTGRRYVWVKGMSKFLVNEVPTITWHRFFPFFPLIFNRVTGRFYGISDVQLQQPLQEEINTKRTYEREAQQASFPKVLVKQGTLNEEEKIKLETAAPYAVVELRAADEVAKAFAETKPIAFDPLHYDIDKPKREIEIMAGIPQIAAGATGDNELATEASIANQQMGIQADRRKDLVETLIHDVYECIIELALQLFPQPNIQQLVGPAAVWPALDREQLWRSLQLDIKAGESGRPDKQKELAAWTSFASLAQSLGVVVNGPAIFKKILDVMELPVDLNKYIVNPALVMQAQMMGIPVPGTQPGTGQPGTPHPAAGGPPQPGVNTAGAPPGGQPGAGSPPMSHRGPPKPQGIPNGPNLPGH